MILANILLYIGLLPSCSAPEETPCDSGTNENIKHVCINKELNAKGSLFLDINQDGVQDWSIALEKDVYNGQVINTIGYLNVLDPSDNFPHYDFLVVKRSIMGDTNLMPQQSFLNDVIDSSIYNWLLRINVQATNAPLFSKADLNPIGQNTVLKEGLVDLGDFYIAFRYYDRNGTPSGWKNGWIKLNASSNGIKIIELAYKKQPETSIKIGEK